MYSGYRRSDSFNIMLFFELCGKVFYMYVTVEIWRSVWYNDFENKIFMRRGVRK